MTKNLEVKLIKTSKPGARALEKVFETLNNNIKILVAEDNDIQLKRINDALNGEGFSVIAAGYGPKVFTQVLNEKPNLVLLDIVMPEVDGIEMCRNLKRSPLTKDILIAMYSSKNDPEFMDMTYEFGADAYILKTEQIETIVVRIKDLLREKGGFKVQ